MPEHPGRVVTLIADADETCVGMAYLVPMEAVLATFEQLDHREKNGYQRCRQTLYLRDGRRVPGLVYIAPVDNFAYLGEAPLRDIAQQIIRSHGPSGSNLEYLLQLTSALRNLNAHDPHVFELECQVRQLQSEAGGA